MGRDRQQVKKLLDDYDMNAVVDLASDHPEIIRDLHYFMYDPDQTTAWRAADSIGRLADPYPDLVEPLIDRLLWSMNEESGSIGWLAAEALGEIARNRPSLVLRIIPTMSHYLSTKATRRGSLWFLGLLGANDPKQVGICIPMVSPCVSDLDPEIRAHAALALARMCATNTISLLEHLTKDESSVQIYEQGNLNKTTVAQVAEAARDSLLKCEESA